MLPDTLRHQPQPMTHPHLSPNEQLRMRTSMPSAECVVIFNSCTLIATAWPPLGRIGWTIGLVTNAMAIGLETAKQQKYHVQLT
jgi:hypothetical protein